MTGLVATQMYLRFLFCVTCAVLTGVSPLSQTFVYAGVASADTVVISELMAKNTLTTLNKHDYIEIFNYGTAAVDLTGWKLTNGSNDTAFIFPSFILQASGRVVVWASGSTQAVVNGEFYANFKLNTDGERVELKRPAAGDFVDVDAVSYPQLGENVAWSRLNNIGPWASSVVPSPNADNKVPVFNPARIFISEIFTTGELDANNVPQDWIEICSKNQRSNLQDYIVADSRNNFYTFPSVIIETNACIQVFATGLNLNNPAEALHTNFSLKDTGEAVYLFDEDGRIVDAFAPILIKGAISYGVNPVNGQKQAFLNPTPGQMNPTEPQPQTNVVLNEIQGANRITFADEDRDSEDWIELYNPGPGIANLTGWSMTDNISTTKIQKFPETFLAPGQYLVLFASGKDRWNVVPHLTFKISTTDKEVVSLLNAAGVKLDNVLVETNEDKSLARKPNGLGAFLLEDKPTPGISNDVQGAAVNLKINEVLAGYVSLDSPDCFKDSLNKCSDWIEIYNPGTEALSLNGFQLSNGDSTRAPWVFPNVSLGAKQYLIVRASGEDVTPGAELHADFRISLEGELLRLLAPNGSVVDSFLLRNSPIGVSQGRSPDGSSDILYYDTPSPDAANPVVAAPVLGVKVNEFLVKGVGAQKDYIELYNTTDQSIAMGGWGLSDNSGSPLKWRFKADQTIAPRQFLLVSAEGNNDPETPPLVTNFQLAQNQDVSLVDQFGRTMDVIEGYGDWADGVSAGRIPDGTGDFKALAQLSPGRANADSSPRFIRGDANADGKVDISDPISVLQYLFTGGIEPKCFDAADSNDDGKVDISDSVSTLNFLFTGGAAPKSPYPNAGADPTEDNLSCNSSVAAAVARVNRAVNAQQCAQAGQFLNRNGIPPCVEFMRGDVNKDGKIDMNDAAMISKHVTSKTPIACMDAADTDDNGRVDINDYNKILSYLRRQISFLPSPFPKKGIDPTVDNLYCK